MTSVLISDELSETKRLAPKYNANVEVRLWDGTRVDLMTDALAIEVDWAPKWAEAVGQALYYSNVAKKRPAIILLVKDVKEEQRYVYRCQTVCTMVGILLFVEESEEE